MFKLGILGGGLNSVAGYTHFVASQMDKRFNVVSGVFSRGFEQPPKIVKASTIKVSLFIFR